MKTQDEMLGEWIDLMLTTPEEQHAVAHLVDAEDGLRRCVVGLLGTVLEDTPLDWYDVAGKLLAQTWNAWACVDRTIAEPSPAVLQLGPYHAYLRESAMVQALIRDNDHERLTFRELAERVKDHEHYQWAATPILVGSAHREWYCACEFGTAPF